jgi:hypothetical protein
MWPGSNKETALMLKSDGLVKHGLGSRISNSKKGTANKVPLTKSPLRQDKGYWGYEQTINYPV